jgi:hypothetical protein
MYRIVYWNGICVGEKWFDVDKDLLVFSLANPRLKILEWKKYDSKEDARPLNTFTY